MPSVGPEKGGSGGGIGGLVAWGAGAAKRAAIEAMSVAGRVALMSDLTKFFMGAFSSGGRRSPPCFVTWRLSSAPARNINRKLRNRGRLGLGNGLRGNALEVASCDFTKVNALSRRRDQ